MKAASRKFRLSAKASKRCPGLIRRAASAVVVKVGVASGSLAYGARRPKLASEEALTAA